jgi:hypothetical protein
VEQRRHCRREAHTFQDVLLTELLSELIQTVDPVPPLVESSARAIFERGFASPAESEHR